MRSVVLALLSWLSPVMGVIAVAFLLALPFTGLDPCGAPAAPAPPALRRRRLVVLLNNVYQDGRTEAPRVLRWTALAVAATIAPLTAIAAYARCCGSASTAGPPTAPRGGLPDRRAV